MVTDAVAFVGLSIGGGFKNWEGLGYTKGGWAENYQLIRIDGKWHVVMTADMGDKGHAPVIAALKGNPDEDAYWTDWSDRRMLKLASESWNPKTPHNAVYLADWRRYDCYFYVIYCGQDGCCVGNYGFRLGMARSPDLQTWYKPGDTGGQGQVAIPSTKSCVPVSGKAQQKYQAFDLRGRLIDYSPYGNKEIALPVLQNP